MRKFPAENSCLQFNIAADKNGLNMSPTCKRSSAKLFCKSVFQQKDN